MLLSVRFVDCTEQNENVWISSKIDVHCNYFDAKGYENVRIMNVAIVFLCIKVITYRSRKHRFEYIDNDYLIMAGMHYCDDTNNFDARCVLVRDFCIHFDSFMATCCV